MALKLLHNILNPYRSKLQEKDEVKHRSKTGFNCFMLEFQHFKSHEKLQNRKRQLFKECYCCEILAPKRKFMLPSNGLKQPFPAEQLLHC